MWKKYFNVKGLKDPGIIQTRHGRFDLSKDNLSIEKLKKVVDDNSSYLELTKEGKEYFAQKEKVTPVPPSGSKKEKV